MNIVASVLAVLLIVILFGSSLADFKKSPQVVAMLSQLKIPEKAIPVLGGIKTAAALGLIVGFFSQALSVVVGICLCMYFAIAAVTHTRVKAPLKEAVPALTLCAVSVLFVLVTLAK